ncbi:hypothetical protein [Pleurocapsa sp. FMAR1]|uniref:hypothetical protein n=1 Tax=Pleurocapsa sp. FMAR1 TaxID=3040204 RepID=UPI0029C61563|nr:hypothetical protein [Pleurocapsa sp. FMAR1]
MNLSYKDLKFILESIDLLLNQYNTRLEKIEDSKEHEDEASDLANDCMFLESLKSEIEQNINAENIVYSSVSSQTKSKETLESLTESTLQLSINERLLLVEAITQSIRKETNLIAS